MRKKVYRKGGVIKKFKDLQSGDPFFMINPHGLEIIETMIYDVKGWKHKNNVSGKAVEVIFYKPVINIEGIDIEKLKEAEKFIDSRVHKTLIVNGEQYLTLTYESVASAPVPMCTDKDVLLAWIRGEAI